MSGGDYFIANTSPMMKGVFLNALKDIEKEDGTTLLSYYEEYFKRENKTVLDTIKTLGSGSDHDPFAFFAGVPSSYHAFKLVALVGKHFSLAFLQD